jgi:hypothetical protein
MCVGFAAFATVFLVAGTILLAAGRLGDVRISLQALTFAFDPIEGRSPITIGGSRETDDIVIAGVTPDQPRMPTGALAIGPDPARPGAFRLRFNRFADEPWIGLVFVRAEAGADVLARLRDNWLPEPQRALGAVPFGPTTVFCLPRPGGVDAIMLDAAAGRLTRNGVPAALALPAQAEVALVRDHVAIGPVGDAPLQRSVLVRGNAGWEVVPLDRGAFLGAGGCERRLPPPAAEAALTPDRGLRLSFQTFLPPEPWQIDAAIAAGTGEAPEGRLVERRSLRVGLGQSEGEPARLRVAFDTPESLRIAARGGADWARGDITLSLGGAQDRAQGVDLAQTRFRAVGDDVARQFVQRVQLSDAGAVVVGRERDGIVPGQPFPLGTTDRATILLERLDLEWAPLRGALLLALAGLVAGVAASWRWRCSSAYAFIVLALVDFLLAFRFLAAFEGAIIDPRPSIVVAVPASVFACALIPYILAALMPTAINAESGRRALWVHSALCAAISLHLLIYNGLPLKMAALIGVLAAAALAVRGRPDWGTALAGWTRRRTEKVMTALRRLVRGAPAAEEHNEEEKAPPGRFGTDLILMLVFALLLGLRLLLPERIAGFSTAMLYTPLFVAFAAFALARAAEALATGPNQVWRWLFWVLLLVAPLAYAALAFFGGDVGFAIVNGFSLLPFIALLALWAPWRKKWIPLVPLLGAALLFILVSAWPSPILGSNWPDSSETSPQAEERRLSLMDDALDNARWSRRLMAWIAPDRFAEAGTREAEELGVALEQMRDYGSQGLFGRGYLNQPGPTELRRYQLTDNLSAIHLLAPFGRAGTATFLLVLGAAAAAVTWRRRSATAGRPFAFPDMLAVLSLWILFAGSSYMVFANLQLVPFAGRNLYMLAASSLSDLLEALALVAMALAGLTWRKAAAP